MVKIKKLIDKFNIKITDDFPTTILDIEIDNDIKNFTKGYKHGGAIFFLGEYDEKDENYKRTYDIKIIIQSLDNIKSDLLDKLIEYNEKKNKDIWKNEKEIRDAFLLLDEDYVEYYISSKDIPTAYIGYNIFGGINRIS